jgi:hypothetical protein
VIVEDFAQEIAALYSDSSATMGLSLK